MCIRDRVKVLRSPDVTCRANNGIGGESPHLADDWLSPDPEL